MADLSLDKVTAGAKDLGGVARKRYVWAALLVAFIIFMTIRYRSQIATKLSSILPSWAKSALGLATLAVFFTVLFTADANAATCCVKPALMAVSHGFGHYLAIAAGILGGGVAFGITASSFGAADIREAKLATGDKFATYDATAGAYATEGPAFDFYVDGQNPVNAKGRPLVAMSQVLEVHAQIDQPYTGTAPIYDDDLALMVKSVKMEENRALGTILDDKVGTGVIIKNVLEFVGLGWNRGADAPVATITVPSPSGTTHASYVRFFTIPHANMLLRNPMDSALWLGIINGMNVRVQMAGANAFASVSTNSKMAGTATQVRLTTPIKAHSHWHWPMLLQFLLETPLAGETITLRNFGQKNASGSEPIDYLFFLARLFNVANLPGNTAGDNVTQIDCQKLGISRCQNVPAFFKARLEDQVQGRSPMGYSDNGNFQQGTTPTGMNMADAKFLAVLQPGLDMEYENMMKLGKGYELPISMVHTSAPTLNDAYVSGSMRKLDLGVGSVLANLSAPFGGKLSATNRDIAIPA